MNISRLKIDTLNLNRGTANLTQYRSQSIPSRAGDTLPGMGDARLFFSPWDAAPAEPVPRQTSCRDPPSPPIPHHDSSPIRGAARGTAAFPLPSLSCRPHSAAAARPRRRPGPAVPAAFSPAARPSASRRGPTFPQPRGRRGAGAERGAPAAGRARGARGQGRSGTSGGAGPGCPRRPRARGGRAGSAAAGRERQGTATAASLRPRWGRGAASRGRLGRGGPRQSGQAPGSSERPPLSARTGNCGRLCALGKLEGPQGLSAAFGPFFRLVTRRNASVRAEGGPLRKAVLVRGWEGGVLTVAQDGCGARTVKFREVLFPV